MNNTEITLDDLAREPITCTTKLHFPERIYFWEVKELPEHSNYYGHCAIYHSDYQIPIPKDMYNQKGINLKL